MQFNRKALLASLLVSMPAPLILGLLLKASDITVFLSTSDGLMTYLVTYVIFVLVAFIAAGLAGSKGPARSSGKAAPRRSKAAATSVGEGEEEGTVKWFNVKKGFGFITRESGDDVFVHFRAIEGRGRRVLRQGQRVKYHVVDADKGLQANGVSVIDGSDEE